MVDLHGKLMPGIDVRIGSQLLLTGFSHFRHSLRLLKLAARMPLRELGYEHQASAIRVRV
jgi:hypothetical protein